MTDNKRKAEAPNNSEKDPERFYCPYPGCNRSFAELWRLKVHYRAPPDIRGSGKERGHGTELTHCPKCGKALKPGKHHVGCSAGRSAPRQASKRSRVNGEDADGRSDLSPAESADQPLTAPSLNLQPVLPFNLENQSASLSSFNVLPYQNGNGLGFLNFENGPSKHPLFPAGLSAENAFPGYLNQLDGMQTLHAHAQAVQAAQVQAAQAAQALQAAQSASNAAAAAAAAVAAVPNHLLYHHHHQQQQHQLLLAANPYMPMMHSGSAFHPSHLLHNPHHIQHHLPLPNPVPMSQPAAAASSCHPPFANSFESIFDYPDGLSERPPSPPPLPLDFPGIGGMLFNFKQFSSKVPNAPLADTHSTDETTFLHPHQQSIKQEDLGKSPGIADSSTDGDLMQILFGLSDDTPASATINLHHSSEDNIKPHGCLHHDAFSAERLPSSRECLSAAAANGGSPKEQTEPQCSKVMPQLKLDTGPPSPADGFLEEASVLHKVDSAAELFRLPDGFNGFSDKSDAGCMSRLLGLDHELFGLLQ